MREVDLLLIGAGPTGLGAAWQCSQHPGLQWLILERSSAAGGLAGSVRDSAGFTWDFGGHVTFSHYEEFDRAMDEALGQDGWNVRDRNAAAYVAGLWIPYPVQHHIDLLPDELRAACVSRSQHAGPVRNFEDWCLASFGGGLTDLFMRPYNEKVWQTPLTELGCYWVQERVAAFGSNGSKGAWGPNSTFRYPRNGGAGAPWKMLAEQVGSSAVTGGIDYGACLAGVEPDKRIAHLSDGTAVRYSWLISTMPLTELAPLAWPELRGHDLGLRKTQVQLIGIGFRGQSPADLRSRSWLYCSSPEVPFYRVSVVSNYAVANVPEVGRSWSLLFECARPETTSTFYTPGEIIRSAAEIGLIRSEDGILSVWEKTLPYGYPVPTVSRDTHLEPILSKLHSVNIVSCGRFGAWRYEVANQDHSFMQGVEAVRKILAEANS